MGARAVVGLILRGYRKGIGDDSLGVYYATESDCVSPLMASAPTSAIRLAIASGQGIPGTRVPCPTSSWETTPSRRGDGSRQSFAHAGNTSKHASNHVVLIAIIDAQVRIGRSDENRINTAIALLQIVQVSVYRVLARGWVIEIVVLDHHPGLDETRLCPLQGGQIVPGSVVADPNTTFRPPVGDVGEP